MDTLKAFASEQLKSEVPQFSVGDGVKVYVRIVEGTRVRTQIFEGTVIARKNGGISETFTVRRVSYGVGTEKTFPLHSPNVQKVEVVRHGKVRRAKLYYLRDKVGKGAKVKELKTRSARAQKSRSSNEPSAAVSGRCRGLSAGSAKTGKNVMSLCRQTPMSRRMRTFFL